MKKRIALLVLCAMLLTACGTTPQTGGPTVAATTAPLAQFLEALCENTDIRVDLVISETVSCLHDYSLTVGQMRTIGSADCLFLSGAGLEEFMADALSQAKATVDCSQNLDLLELDGESDPHIWLAPKNAEVMAKNAADGLTALYPQYGDTFRKNLAALIARLEDLQQYGEDALKDLSCRELITFHDGFAYFAGAFDLTILASIEEESGSEASAKSLAEISTLVESHNIPVVFMEANGSTAGAEAIARETGCGLSTLSTGLGGGDYFDILRQNIDAVKEALA